MSFKSSRRRKELGVIRGWPRDLPLRLEALEGRFLPSGLPHLLKYINGHFADATANAFAANAFADVNAVAFFAASDGTAHGTELWRPDGSAAGTQMVKDIFPPTLVRYRGFGGRKGWEK